MWRPASSRRRPCSPHRLLLVALAASLLSAGCSAAGKDKENSTAGPAAVVTGGAATLQGKGEQDLLKWALSHSDPEALRAAAAAARKAADAGSSEFAEKQQRVQALLDAMKGEPTEAELMQEAVAILHNASSTRQQQGNALEALRYLVEPIDNANNLQGMGGLAPVVAFLGRQQPPALQARAAHLLGTAASNNNVFQEQLLGDHPEALPMLLHLLSAGSSASASSSSAGSEGDEQQQAAAEEAAVRALYCLSTILRLSAPARSAFYEVSGLPALQALLAASAAQGGSLRLKRKALTLLEDLLQLDSAAQQSTAQEGAAQEGAIGLDQRAAVAAALQLLDVTEGEGDTDMQEKALLVLLALLDASDQVQQQPSRAAMQIAEAGGEAIVQRLEEAWRRDAEAAGASAAGENEGEDPSFLLELVALCRRVRQRVAAAREQAGGTAHAAGSLGGGRGGAPHDSSEL
ncbi:hsp70 nucleotide exchange factor FES1 isoform X1 [Chlorella sorokiniana]|uniref:Hsp70 nucleotide exchange factor FES1 isoform X1 n=1 Tax=Chlorella sorokiniana TaxID=3076 RepID=A0A2P6TX62_CHLSO|nr:hsp70 nucleotide exchange factor FES1 isoform X1 [Chlorella sorokiniana]|eukprot:PRW58654.1 hsp70 nucleotide exchange factor FES1 isoform X1 [Chlorella sorokiniana]